MGSAMAALSWQISNDGTLDLAPNKNCFEVFQINFLINWGWGGFVFFQVLEGTLETIFSLCTVRLTLPPIISLLGKKKQNREPQVDLTSELNPTSIFQFDSLQR